MLHYERQRDRGACKVNGCEKRAKATGLCSMHYERARSTGEAGPSGRLRVAGKWSDWFTTSWGYTARRRIRDGRAEFQFQHRHVMEQHLGRELLPHENVHHVNGDRADNRIENLELWTKAQPAGQRVADKVAFALEILALYAPERLAE